MLKYVEILLVLFSLGIAYGDDPDTSLLIDPHPPRQSPDLIQRSLEMTPGTKWCGETTTAASDSDFGDEIYADICCWDHYVNCFHIEPNDERYGLSNDNPYTVSSCDCDKKLRDCLAEHPEDDTANLVRWKFFGIQHPECITIVRDKLVYASSPVRDPELAKLISIGLIGKPTL